MLTFGTIEFRNGIYQGTKSSLSPQQQGIYFDDDLHFHCSHWKQSLMNSHTAIIISHAKYIYGEWKDGVPDGFNVFRTGENVVLAMFERGEVVGEFIVIFERQGYVIVGVNERGVEGEREMSVVEKREFKNEVQLKKIISSTLTSVRLEEQHFSLVKYLNSKFCEESSTDSNIKLYFENGVYHFGYPNGLKVVFDDDVFIYKIGNIDDEQQMCGLGVLYDKIIEIGNFSNGLVLKYKENQRPTEQIKKLFKNQHKRSMYFRNDFMFTKTAEVIAYLEGLMKGVINVVARNRVETERSLTKEELNESMEYRPRPFELELNQENKRLKIMREELHRSIGYPSNIKPAFYDNKTPNRHPDDIKQLHLSRLENQRLSEPESISFSKGNGRSREQNRKSFVKENKLEDYRDGKSNNKDRMLKGSRTYYNEPVAVEKISYVENTNAGKAKNVNEESSKSFNKSPMKTSKYDIEKSPSRNYLNKESQVSTAHKNINKYQLHEDNYDTYDDHNYTHTSNKRFHNLHPTQHEQLDDSLQSPYRKHLFNDSILEHESKQQTRKNSSRQYIPISHNKTVNAAKKSPEKKAKEPKQFKDFPPKEFKQQHLKPQSYIALYKNSSPTSNKTHQKSPPKKVQISPLKNPYYDRDTKQNKSNYSGTPSSYYPPPAPPVVYTKEPISHTNPYLKRSQDLQQSMKSVSPERVKMLQKINKKYNYNYNNL